MEHDTYREIKNERRNENEIEKVWNAQREWQEERMTKIERARKIENDIARENVRERGFFVFERAAAWEQFLQIFYNPALFRQSWVNQRMELQLKPGFSSDIKFQFPLSDRILLRKKTCFVKIWHENYFWVSSKELFCSETLLDACKLIREKISIENSSM